MNLLRLCCGVRPTAAEQPAPAPAPRTIPPRATPLGEALREVAWLMNKCALLLSHESLQVGIGAAFHISRLWTRALPGRPQALNSPEYLACQQMLNGTRPIAPGSAANLMAPVTGVLPPAPAASGGFAGNRSELDDCKKYVAAQQAALTVAELDSVIDQRAVNRAYAITANSMLATATGLAGAVVVPFALNKLAFLIDHVTHDANEWTGKAYRRAAKYFAALGVIGMAVSAAGAAGFKQQAAKIQVEAFDPRGLKVWNPSEYRAQRLEQTDAQRNAELLGWFVLSSAVFGAAAVPFAVDRWGRYLIAQETEAAAAARFAV